MKVTSKRFDKKLSLPQYEEGAAGFDFTCRFDVTIKPKTIGVVHLNIAMKVPKGYFLLIVPRSSTPHRKGLMMPHSIGVVDPYYSGPENEIVTLLYNFTNKAVKVKRGDQIVQGLLIKHEFISFDESKKLKTTKRKMWKAPKVLK